MLNEINLSQADLNLLVVYEAVLAERHVARAAKRLRLTPSAVSHGLGRLRQLLQDPLFVRTPKGVVPTARALELAAPIAEILSRVRSVLSSATPFQPATSTRRFSIGAPDGASAVFLPVLLGTLRGLAPRVDISIRQLLPTPGKLSPERAWQPAFDELEARAIDVAVIPLDRVPARFLLQPLYDEDFVVAARAGHPFLTDPGLDHYCELAHLVVSFSGDPFGFVDDALAKRGRRRRVALTVSNFMFALPLIADSDLIAALPRSFVAMHAARFGVTAIEPPLPLPRFQMHAVVPRAALMDEGLAWLLQVMQKEHAPRRPKRRTRR
jgi:DNA-binding transcriptional LysR family regulator